MEIAQRLPINTTKNRILRLDDSLQGPNSTKRGGKKDSLSKFFLMDCFLNSRSKSNMNNDSTLNNNKGNSLEVKFKNTSFIARQNRRSKSPKEQDSKELFGNKSTYVSFLQSINFMINPDWNRKKALPINMAKVKTSKMDRLSRNNNSGLLKITSSNNLQTSGKIERRHLVKKRIKLYPEQSVKELVHCKILKRRENSLENNLKDFGREEDSREIEIPGCRSTKAENRRGCTSLDMGYKNDMVTKLQLPISFSKNRDISPECSLGSGKKSFTQQTTLTLNHKPVHPVEEAKKSDKITDRIAELFSRIEREEGESDEVTQIKQEISASFKVGSEGPKTTLHFYKILKLLGKGSFGKVYMSSQVLTNRIVAIKCLDKKIVKEETRKNKIMHELLMFKTLTGHPNVIQIYEVFENKKYFFFVMEYASGGDLLQLMKNKGKLSEKMARAIFVQLLRGLKHIHSKNILHRDIKLDNILLTESEGELKAKICDFGVSRFITDSEVINEQCGTPAYIAPEIIKKKGYKGFGADIWSLGVLLYAMVMGAMPFKAQNIEGLHQKILDRECEMKDSSVTREAKDLIDRMLTVDPERRISLADIIHHPWLKDDPKLQTINNESRDLINQPEEFVMQKISRFGFPVPHLATSIRNYSLNHAFACYMTLAKDFE
jgi:serine/threonine protein kinase